MIIITPESFSLKEIRPFPNAQSRKTQKGGRKSAILTDTSVKTALEEEANSAKKEGLQKLVRNRFQIRSQYQLSVQK